MSLIQSHELPSARFEYDGYIITVTFQNDMDVDEEEARNHIEVAHKLTGGAPACVLIDTTQSYTNVSPDARKILAGKGHKNIPKIAEALVIKHLHSRLLARFYVRFDSTDTPIRVFSDCASARSWLETFRK